MMIRRSIPTAIALLAGAAVTAMAAARKTLAKQFLNVGGKKPPGYTHVVVSAPGKMIFVSGQGGNDEQGNLPADFATQAHNTFKNLGKCLALAGAGFNDIVKINYYVTDMNYLAELRQIRASYLNMDAPPAATLVQSGLAPGLLVEIECTAMVPEK
jgi:enamine deaminase RidA (YjgF/YER057c/UK114 family)